MRVRRKRLFIISFVVIIIIIVLMVTPIYFAEQSNKNVVNSPANHTDCAGSLPCPLKHFNMKDGVNIRWYPNANSLVSLQKALTGKYHMIGGCVTVSKNGDLLIGEMTVEAWLDQVLAKNIGIKLTFTNDSTVEQTLMFLKQKSPLKRPVYLSVKVLSFADKNRAYIDRIRFFDAVSRLLPEVRLSIVIDSGSLQEALTPADIETVSEIIKPLRQAVSLEMDPVLVKQSWSVLRPWITSSKNNDVIMTQSSGTVNIFSEFDLLLIRNDCDGDKVYYNMKGDTFDKFLSLKVTAESPILSFGVTPRDASRIIWKHAVNSKAKLDKILNDSSVMMLEADIVMGNETGTNNTNIPIMAHPPNKTSDLTFENFLNRVIQSKKGIQLNFKKLDSISPALNMANKLKDNITVPVWLSASIKKGHNRKDITMTTFLDHVKVFPAAVLSLGWNTPTIYTMDMVKEMHELCKNLSQPVTFPVRADKAKDSLASLDWLLQQSRGYSLTIWSTLYNAAIKSEMNYVRRNTEAARVYFDLPSNLMPDFYN